MANGPNLSNLSLIKYRSAAARWDRPTSRCFPCLVRSSKMRSPNISLLPLSGQHDQVLEWLLQAMPWCSKVSFLLLLLILSTISYLNMLWKLTWKRSVSTVPISEHESCGGVKEVTMHTNNPHWAITRYSAHLSSILSCTDQSFNLVIVFNLTI